VAARLMQRGSPVRILRRTVPVASHDWSASVHAVVQRVYAARGVECPTQAGHRLAGLLAPDRLGGIERAMTLLGSAICQGDGIVVVGDYDCDGATGCAVAVRGLKLLGARNVTYAVPNRAVHGYGLSPALVETLDPVPTLIVTVDNGVASIAGVAAAQARGSKVIVTDHHLPGTELPTADAMVNPNLPGDGFGSKALCGVGVLFYLLLALRAQMRADGAFRARGEPDLSALLDLVALGTVADLVPLDTNNRALVEGGLRRMRRGRACPGIQALFEISGRDIGNAVAADLGYAIGPRINAAGRLEDMTIGIECLLANAPSRARQLAATLNAINQRRRDLQASMVDEALVGLDDIDVGSATGVSLFQPAWHHGVVGLVASKMKERLHRPVVAFAPVGGGDTLRGSARSVPGFHVRDALAEVEARYTGLIERFGGHAMAAGLTLKLENYVRFAETFDAVVRERISPAALQATLYTDGELTPADFDLELARQLERAGPWGQGFPAPLFDNVFECVDCRSMGAAGVHRRLKLRDPRGGDEHAAVWFHAGCDVPLHTPLRTVYELTVNDWQGRQSLRLLIRHVELPA
jgi:single-stranded-DNA-specific exonuclease